MKIEFSCFACGKGLSFSDRVGFRESCPHCSADLHVCRNCRHYDEKVYNECREPSAERVRDKDRANYCEFFDPSQGASSREEEKKDLLSAAEALFKKKS